jgi:hypothetical protein
MSQGISVQQVPGVTAACPELLDDLRVGGPGPTGEDPVHRFTEDNVVHDLTVVNSPPAFGLPFYYGAFVAKVCWCRAGGSQPGTAGRRPRLQVSPDLSRVTSYLAQLRR